MRKLETLSLILVLCLCAGEVLAQSADPKGEMIAFVERIAEHARVSNASFGIFPQNASELGADAGYLACVTGMGQEDTYYGYKKDGKATPVRVTGQIEGNLDVFESAGRLVLTIDYPFKDPDLPSFGKKTRSKVDSAYSRALAKGYVPTCTVRNLDALVACPGHEPQPNEPVIADWSQVREFLYELQPAQGQDRGGFLGALAGSKFDLIVMDYSFDGSGEQEFTPEEIAALKTALGGKVVAYLSIGEAEDYRWYWNPAWDADHDGIPDPGAPAWLDKENPEWPGNFKVRYWDPAWQAIILQYLDKILARGFDGAYLDLVDAYEYYPRDGISEPENQRISEREQTQPLVARRLARYVR